MKVEPCFGRHFRMLLPAFRGLSLLFLFPALRTSSKSSIAEGQSWVVAWKKVSTPHLACAQQYKRNLTAYRGDRIDSDPLAMTVRPDYPPRLVGCCHVFRPAASLALWSVHPDAPSLKTFGFGLRLRLHQPPTTDPRAATPHPHDPSTEYQRIT